MMVSSIWFHMFILMTRACFQGHRHVRKSQNENCTSQLSVLLRVWIGHVQNGLLLLQIYREDH